METLAVPSDMFSMLFENSHFSRLDTQLWLSSGHHGEYNWIRTVWKNSSDTSYTKYVIISKTRLSQKGAE